jgi:transcriptional regulator with XRE-family HTH domain
MMDPRMGLRLRLFRKKEGRKQIEIAALFGYKTGNPISLMERGKRELRIEHLSILREYLGLDLNWLITGSRVIDCGPREDRNGYDFAAIVRGKNRKVGVS